ncbi:MAG TPA: alkaline phosphatase family protein [Polyangiaceae bacterium]
MRRLAWSILFAWPLTVAACGSGGGGSSEASDSGEHDDATAIADAGATADDGAPTDAGASPNDAAREAGDASNGPRIKYVLVLVKENHTFDNYFTGFPGADTTTTAKLSNGSTLTRPTAPNGQLSQDICHANSCGQKAYSNGSMSGFDLIGAGDLPFIRYTEQQIPNYWQYARNFVLVDHLFSTTLGPSTPGHAVFWGAQSLVLDNAGCTKDGGACGGFGCAAGSDVKVTAYDPDTCTTSTVSPCFDAPVLADHLPSGFTWTDYGGELALMFKSVYDTSNYQAHFRAQSSLVSDLMAGKLANLMIAHLWSGEESEHPAADPCPGENFTVQIVNAAMATPEWNEMAIVITWDDWGGFYDHVAPPVHKCKNGEIFQNGFRLPAIILSPYAKKGVVLSTPAEQASIPRLIEDLWGMTYMSTRDPHARDGDAGSLMGAFDFAQAPRAPLPLTTRTCP